MRTKYAPSLSTLYMVIKPSLSAVITSPSCSNWRLVISVRDGWKLGMKTVDENFKNCTKIAGVIAAIQKFIRSKIKLLPKSFSPSF